MTYYGAIRVLEGSIDASAEVMQEAINMAIDALYELDKIKNYGCVVCKMSKEYDCNGCAYEEVEDWKDPCRICRRNQKDYYREAEKHENKNN